MMESKPVLVSCNFIVDHANGNALGIRSLKGPLVKSVFMNATSAAATTTTSVFASGALTITVLSLTNLVVGMVVTDSTTSGNITGGTTIAAINPATNQITLSVVTAGASASAPGDTLSFAATAALVGNPNPAAGYAVIVLQDNYRRSLGGFNSIVSPVSGSAVKIDNSAMTVGLPYIITTLDPAITTAMWQTLGVPAGLTPSIGLSFIAALVGLAGEANTSSARVMVPAAAGSGIFTIETVGDPNQSIAPVGTPGSGAQFIIRFLKVSSAPAPVIGTPTDNTVVGISFLLSDSSTQVQGE